MVRQCTMEVPDTDWSDVSQFGTGRENVRKTWSAVRFEGGKTETRRKSAACPENNTGRRIWI